MALANLLENRVQGALIRSQFLDITEMDAPSNVFVRLEKKRGQSKAIQLLALWRTAGTHRAGSDKEASRWVLLMPLLQWVQGESGSDGGVLWWPPSGLCGEQLTARLATVVVVGGAARCSAGHAGMEGTWRQWTHGLILWSLLRPTRSTQQKPGSGILAIVLPQCGCHTSAEKRKTTRHKNLARCVADVFWLQDSIQVIN